MVQIYLVKVHVFLNLEGVRRSIVIFPQVSENGWEAQMFLLHLLVMTAALFGLPSANKLFHGLEDLISSPEVTIHEVLIVDLQKPVVHLVFLYRPVPPVDSFEPFLLLPALPSLALGSCGRRVKPFFCFLR